MKNKFLYQILSLTISFFILCCQDIGGQTSATPEAVVTSFQSKYPGENDPDWRIDKNENYEAHFKKSGIHYRADFAPSGSWIETENSVKKKELPKAITKLLKDKYEDHKIIELEFVTHHQKGEFYDVELKPKGEDKFDLMVKANGQVIGRD